MYNVSLNGENKAIMEGLHLHLINTYYFNTTYTHTFTVTII